MMSKQKAHHDPEASKQIQTKPAKKSNPLKTAVSQQNSPNQSVNLHSPLSPDAAANLQQTIGNQAVGRLLIQPKLTLGPVGDQYEQEADAIAKQVVTQLSTDPPTAQRQEDEELQMKPVTAVQRQEDEELQMKTVQRQEDEELQMKPLQRQSTAGYSEGEVSTDVEQTIQSARGSGQPLSDTIRTPMESAFGADFSSVSVHTNSQSDALNQSLQARAFTTGQDIFFRQGEYNPSSSSGQELLAHELTHVVQQNGASIKRQGDGEDKNVGSE